MGFSSDGINQCDLLGVSKFGLVVERIILATSSPVTLGITKSVMIMSKPGNAISVSLRVKDILCRQRG